MENKLALSEVQIALLEDLNREQILERIDEAGWSILDEKTQNGISIFTLIDRVFVCVCGKEPVHWHNAKIACCGGSDCCPENVPRDYELEIAWNVSRIRQMLQERKELAVKNKQ